MARNPVHPFTEGGYICGTEAILSAANNYLVSQDSSLLALDASGSSPDDLFRLVSQDTPVLVWVTIAMEEQVAAGADCDADQIVGLKSALMGPLAGIGDSFFWGTFRIIGAGIGASLAAQGSILGAILFLLIYNIPHFLVRYQGLRIGYKSGVNFLAGLSQGGVIAALTEAAKILGLVVVGSMAASMVSLSTPLVFTISGAEIVVQDIFDAIITGFLPLCLTLGTYKLLQKGIKTTTILWGMIIVGIIGSVIGIF